ncbi:MAG: hypothetical protein [Circular genetic element sp.]|nr:MAG: hypothetical protein [Circular genetic element sp.]
MNEQYMAEQPQEEMQGGLHEDPIAMIMEEVLEKLTENTTKLALKSKELADIKNQMGKQSDDAGIDISDIIDDLQEFKEYVYMSLAQLGESMNQEQEMPMEGEEYGMGGDMKYGDIQSQNYDQHTYDPNIRFQDGGMTQQPYDSTDMNSGYNGGDNAEYGDAYNSWDGVQTAKKGAKLKDNKMPLTALLKYKKTDTSVKTGARKFEGGGTPSGVPAGAEMLATKNAVVGQRDNTQAMLAKGLKWTKDPMTGQERWMSKSEYEALKKRADEQQLRSQYKK